MPDNTTITELEIKMPATTVELAAPDGGTVTYTTIKATTATNTLVIGKGVTVTSLEAKGGNVDILNGGVVTGITLAAGSVMSSDKKGKLTNMTAGASVDLNGLQVGNLVMIAENNAVTLTVKVAAHESQKILSRGEQLEEMRKQNPAVGKLCEAFGLVIA